MVLSAEEGITGVLSGAAGDAVGVGAEESESAADDVDPDPPKADPGKRDTRRASTASHKMRSRFTLDRMRELDAEGRCLVVDFGRFVLINVYVPAVTSSDPVEGARCVSQIPPPCYISQLVTVQTDYGDSCPYIVQYTPSTGLTLSFLYPKRRRAPRSSWISWTP